MNMINPQDELAPGQVHRPRNRVGAFFFHFLLPAAILAAGVALTVYMLKTAPEATPAKRPPTPTLVEVAPMASATHPTLIEAMGEVVPSRQIELRPRVSGEIIGVSKEFLPGGHFTTGQTMLRIDPTDYRLTMGQLESEAEKAESDLALEMGNQRIAAKEFALVNEQVSPEERALILRQPQLAKLKATLVSSQARLEQARINLERTEIKAPFNCVITARNADMGTRVNESTVLATLVGTDSFWLRLTLPLDQLRWLDIPETDGESGSPVRIYPPGSQDFRQGEIIRLEPALESQGRMAQLLVRVDDPLCFKEENRDKVKLLLGSYVTAEVIGSPIESAFSLSRSHVHDGNTIWLMDKAGNLEIREVTPLFRNRDQVIVAEGISSGERLVTSPLSSPVAGIPLRLPGQEGAAQGKRQAAKGQAGQQRNEASHAE